MDFLTRLGAPEVCRRVLDVLAYMESLQLNLPILLWALCWNDSYPDLVLNNKARFARTVLTTSELLPGILRLWHGIADVGKVDKSAVVFFEEIDELDIAVLSEIAFQLVLGERLKVFNVANIHVTRCTRVHGQGESRLEWTSIFAPTKFDSPIVQRQTLI